MLFARIKFYLQICTYYNQNHIFLLLAESIIFLHSYIISIFNFICKILQHPKINPGSAPDSHVYHFADTNLLQIDKSPIKTSVQDKALCIINFQPNTAPASEIYETSKILKLSDYISLQNALLVKNCFEKQLPQPLLNFFKKTTEQPNHSTRSVSINFAFVEEANSKSYGIDSIRSQALIIWNKLQNNITSDLTELSRMKVKSTIIEHFLKSY